MIEYFIYMDSQCVGKEYTEEVWKNKDILQMNIHSILYEYNTFIKIEYDFNNKALIYYRIYDQQNNRMLCEMECVENKTYIIEKKFLWRVNKNFIPYELAKYKMPICIQMSEGGFIPYYDITKKEMLYLSVRKKSQCGYQILSPEYSELLYNDQILEKYTNRSLFIIRK